MARRTKKNAAKVVLLWGAVAAVSGAAVAWYAWKHPGPGAAALFIAWLLPGVPPPGPFGETG